MLPTRPSVAEDRQAALKGKSDAFDYDKINSGSIAMWLKLCRVVTSYPCVQPVTRSANAVLAHLDTVIHQVPSVRATTSALFDLSAVDPADVSEHVKKCFDSLDMLNRGYLDHDDFMKGCRQLGRDMSPGECEHWIEQADVDGNGQVDFEEFEHLARKVFNLRCGKQCTICAMDEMAANMDASDKSKPRSPSSSVKFRLKKARIKAALCNDQIKSLGTEMNEFANLRKDLQAMVAQGFKRCYSDPSTSLQRVPKSKSQEQETSVKEKEREESVEEDKKELLALFEKLATQASIHRLLCQWTCQSLCQTMRCTLIH